MKVKIGPYKNWFGPYQLAEKLCFWVKDETDEYGIKSKPEWVHNFGEFLAHGKILPEPAVGEVYITWEDRRKTWLYRFLSWVDSKKSRKIKVQIDPWDTWNMETTLGYIIRPMLKQLKGKKNGAPFVDPKDCPPELKPKKLTKKERDNGHIDNTHFDRWDWVLDEMIFAFESLDGGINQDWEEQFTTGEYDFQLQKEEGGISKMIQGPNHTAETDWDGRKEYSERVTNGFRLFGKYYEALWD